MLSPPFDRSPILVIVFGESKVVHQVHVDWVTVMLEGYLDVKDAIIDIIEPSFKANIGGDINLMVPNAHVPASTLTCRRRGTATKAPAGMIPARFIGTLTACGISLYGHPSKLSFE